ncbi:Hypothetical predicted protein [Olea europaea subsp. europaea]|uniref:Uncharacterized protein n=1 Tax=Olea europaea subsp. europaea TaxID=158383 RepID=A0A8S0TZ25_OLEEU|nr:Hypothetical predicted protein [Olea europaea subsp. europaea]
MNQSFVSSSNTEKLEAAFSRWSRATACAAKVGKGLSKDEKAKELATDYWLEAIDLRHRYGHNLNLYHDAWCNSQSSQPFFYWLDMGDGKDVDLKECRRMDLESQVIQYLAPKEREAYEVIVEHGKLVYRQGGAFVDTSKGIKWMFVLSTSRSLYVGQKKRGMFQHSSFVAGAATIAAGRIVASNGLLEAIWAYSGHYCPTEEHFMELIQFLEEHHVDLTNVKKGPIDDDVQPVVKAKSVDNTSAPPLENSIPPVKTGNESGVVRSNAI